MRVKFLVALFASVLIGTAVVRANDPSEETAHEIFNSVMSPFCPGRLLNDCPSSSAAELKDKIRTELRSGMTKQEVLEEVYGTFGSEFRAAPENRGFGVFAWWTPVAFLLIGGMVIAAWLRRSQSAEKATPEKSEKLSPEMQRRIDEELRRF